MKRTVIYFAGVYDTLDLFTEKLREAFEEMGYESFVYDAATENDSKHTLIDLLEMEKAGCTEQNSANAFACVTFNNLGYNLALPDGRNIWEAYDVPYINILMDHPFHYEKPLRNAPATAMVLCVDRNHTKYIRKYFKNIRQTDFLPHAGVELGSRHKPLAERGIDVLYAGALPIYTVAKMIPDLSSIREVDGQMMAQDILAELVQNPNRTTEEVIAEYLRDKRNDISEQRIHEIIVQMRFIDSYATSFFREQAVRILVESGIRVTAYGTGWNQCEWSDNTYLDYRGKVLAPEILPLMNDSKVVLNTMTWFKAGAHDRVFNGMLAGAAVVTDDSTYMKSAFRDGEELVMFSLKELGTLPERIFSLFGHMDETQQMTNRGYHAAKENHTWKNRAEYIREYILLW